MYTEWVGEEGGGGGGAITFAWRTTFVSMTVKQCDVLLTVS